MDKCIEVWDNYAERYVYLGHSIDHVYDEEEVGQYSIKKYVRSVCARCGAAINRENENALQD